MLWDPKWHKDLMSEEAKLALDIFKLIYKSIMNKLLSITTEASNQIKILSTRQMDLTQ